MADCTRCGAALISAARFCAACGNPVATLASPARPPAAPEPPPRVPTAPLPPPPASAADPFANTLQREAPPDRITRQSEVALSPEIAVRKPSRVSPLASSVAAKADDFARLRRDRDAQAAAKAPAAAAPAPVASPSPALPNAPPMPPAATYHPGAPVLVFWSDGNRYPATVLRVTQGHVLVGFTNGHQLWVELAYVSPGA